MLPTSKISLLNLFVVPALLAILAYVAIVKENPIGRGNENRDGQSRYTEKPKLLPLAISKWNPNENLQTVKRVFAKLGHQVVDKDEKNWDVLWTLEYPFEYFGEILENFTGGQIMNHIAGITYLTNKKYLSTSSISKYIPAAFSLPHLKNEFLYYISSYPDKKYVVKNFDNRGVKIIDPDRIDFQLGEDKFVQEFISNPLLVDGHAFDIGVYVLITSIDPLRIYRWKNEVFLRFCPEPYHPFDPENRQKYVVDEKHKNYLEIPSIGNITRNLNVSAHEAFGHYLLAKGHDIDEFWKNIDDAIISLTVGKVNYISKYVERFKSRHLDRTPKTFELLRCDFILDENFNLFLMEMNMSPNLTPTRKVFEPQGAMYEKIIFGTANLVGITLKDQSSCPLNESMFSTQDDVVTGIDKCLTCLDDEGNWNCESESCSVCSGCLSEEMVAELHMAYREFHRRGNYRLIFPNLDYMDSKFLSKLSGKSKLMSLWYERMCEKDPEWIG